MNLLTALKRRAGNRCRFLTLTPCFRILPTPSGTRSAYGPTGIVPGTERGERFAVWPLGLEDAGAMREWGRHATALVGRRQFDDADLIERRFSLQPAERSDATRVSDR